MFPIIRTAFNIAKNCPMLRLGPQNFVQNTFLTPIVPTVTPICGFKVKGNLKRRCKDCYFVKRENRMYIICPTHPRHKQMAMAKDPKNTWILSHATQGKVRPW